MEFAAQKKTKMTYDFFKNRISFLALSYFRGNAACFLF